MKKISAVIPTYNTKQYIIDAIDSLLTQTYPVSEIIVVDNASTDGTAAAIKRIQKKPQYKKVVLIEEKKNGGVTGGRNAGFRVAKGDYILLFDSDMIAEPTLTKEMVRCLESKKDIGIVTPKIYFWDNKKVIWSAGTDINLTTGQVLFHGGEDQGQFSKEKEVAIAPAVLLVKRSITDKIGAFDDIYFATYEDTDFCFRAKRHGILTYYTPAAVAYHKIPYDNDLSSRRLLQRAYLVAKNRIIFMNRYGRNFLIFSVFIPGYCLYYFKLALSYQNPKAIGEYFRGLKDGFAIAIKEKLIVPFTYPWIFKRFLGKAITVLDLGTGNGSFISLINTNRQYYVTGIELFDQYINQAKITDAYQTLLPKDINKIVVAKKSFDVVMSSQVIEHLTQKEGMRLLSNMEHGAKREVIIGTPNGHFHQEMYDGNHLQEHHSEWDVATFRSLGYRVYGQGLKLVYGEHGLLQKTTSKPVQYFLMFASYVASPIIYYLPEFAAHLIAVKKI